MLDRREDYLKELQRTTPCVPARPSPSGLGPGNSKTGRSGSRFASVFVWNLPSVVTCPGATQWCRRHCYNADPRKGVFPVEEWAENWWWAENSPSALGEVIDKQLAAAVMPCAVRLHSSGDFYSSRYISFWIRIVRRHPSVTFWAYTRSWVVPGLLSELEVLRCLANVHLFASWDRHMPSVPAWWPRSLVFDNEDLMVEHMSRSPRANLCREQIREAESCASCGMCMTSCGEDVVFFLH